jgi:hypothetical protein
MTTFQEYEQTFADLLEAPTSGAADLLPSLRALIDAIPYYTSPTWHGAHRGALVNLLQVNLPNHQIAGEPTYNYSNYSTRYRYDGSYSGYQNAFFTNVAQSPAAAAVATQVQRVNTALNSSWWGSYSVTILTDAVRQVVGLGLDTGKLSGDLSRSNALLLPSLSATCLAVFTNGYAPTANAYQAIVNAGQTAQAQASLNSAILNGQFTANINLAIAMGGNSTTAAVWFLFNLWIALKALGTANVDSAITAYQNAGLIVPPQVGPGSWWNGGYTSWYLALSGWDVRSGTITAGMPEMAVTTGGAPFSRTTTVANGYSQSLCYWGALSWYIPPPDSCFGAGTGVWMADGTTKPIEQVKAGDMVQTTLGARPVLLVEAPARAGRPLYQLGDARVIATAGHPFRASSSSPVRSLAVDPWALADGVPTMGGGIGTLTAGAALTGAAADGPRDVTVGAIQQLPPPTDDTEAVYDLIVGESGSPAYYVGGPEVFFAVDAETADPSFDLPATIGIAAMMQLALPVLREHPPAATAQLLRTAISSIAVRDVVADPQDAFAGDTTLPAVPGPGFFTLPDGSWDAQASALEACLVRRFGRPFRRAAANGWRSDLTIVHDFELIGDTIVPAGAAAEVRLELLGGDVIQTLPIAAGKARGFVAIDAPASFGSVPEGAAIVAIVSIEGQPVGRAHTRAGAEGIEHFLFAPDGRVIGRIAIEQRGAGAPGTAPWSRSMAMRVTARLGQRMAARINAAVQ